VKLRTRVNGIVFSLAWRDALSIVIACDAIIATRGLTVL
jgi:hypothetical protein